MNEQFCNAVFQLPAPHDSMLESQSEKEAMSRTITTMDQTASLALPPEAVEALGVEPGAELDVEIVGRALVVRSVEEARRSREFIDTFESILSRRRKAYERLAEGPET